VTTCVQEAAYDAELQSGLEAQKRLREQILRRKEMRRQMQAEERRHEITQHQQPVTSPTGTSTVTTMNLMLVMECYLKMCVVLQKKTPFDYIFSKCRTIFLITSLAGSQRKYLYVWYRDFNCTAALPAE